MRYTAFNVLATSWSRMSDYVRL